MGNRLSRKTQRASAAKTAPRHEAVVAATAPNSAQPKDELVPRKDESPAEKNETVWPPSAREAPPPTARDDDSNEESSLEFFRHCYALEEDPFTLYTQALLLKDQREFAVASELLRSLLSNSILSLEANYHLAQCLLAQDPSLRSCREEVVRCLENVLAAKSSSKSADAHESSMFRESLEMLAHVMIADRRFDRALELLDALQVDIDADAAPPPNQTAYRQQQTLAGFQRASCRYARGDSPEAISSELLRVLPPNPKQEPDQHQDASSPEVSDPLEGIELLLHADATSLREGLLLLST